MWLTTRYSYVTNLEHRIAELERKVNSLQNEATTAQPAPWPGSRQDGQSESAPGQTTEPFIRLDKDDVQDLSPEECEDNGIAISQTPNTLNFFGVIFLLCFWYMSSFLQAQHPMSI